MKIGGHFQCRIQSFSFLIVKYLFKTSPISDINFLFLFEICYSFVFFFFCLFFHFFWLFFRIFWLFHTIIWLFFLPLRYFSSSFAYFSRFIFRTIWIISNNFSLLIFLVIYQPLLIITHSIVIFYFSPFFAYFSLAISHSGYFSLSLVILLHSPLVGSGLGYRRRFTLILYSFSLP